MTTTTGPSRADQSTHTHATGAQQAEHRTACRRADQQQYSAFGHHVPNTHRVDLRLRIAQRGATEASSQVADLCQSLCATL